MSVSLSDSSSSVLCLPSAHFSSGSMLVFLSVRLCFASSVLPLWIIVYPFRNVSVTVFLSVGLRSLCQCIRYYALVCLPVCVSCFRVNRSISLCLPVFAFLGVNVFPKYGVGWLGLGVGQSHQQGFVSSGDCGWDDCGWDDCGWDDCGGRDFIGPALLPSTRRIETAEYVCFSSARRTSLMRLHHS